MLARVNIPYRTREKLTTLSREDYAAVREGIFQLKIPEWEEKDEKAPYWYGYDEDYLLDLETDGQLLSRYGIPFEVKKFKGTYWGGERYPAEKPTVQSTVQVSIPNLALLMIDEVTWLEDECTERLQEKLDEGWRILAVCPPNSQRRPDYILGRTKS